MQNSILILKEEQAHPSQVLETIFLACWMQLIS